MDLAEKEAGVLMSLTQIRVISRLRNNLKVVLAALEANDVEHAGHYLSTIDRIVGEDIQMLEANTTNQIQGLGTAAEVYRARLPQELLTRYREKICTWNEEPDAWQKDILNAYENSPESVDSLWREYYERGYNPGSWWRP